MAFGQATQGTLAFTVSMPQPGNHTFHVILRAGGLKGEVQDFKMPVWSPGFYGIGDYSRNVGKNVKRTFSFQPVSNPTPLQAAILKDWLRPVQ